MILGDDFRYRTLVAAEEDEVFDIVEQFGFLKEAVNEIFDADSVAADGFAVGLFFFGVAEPLKEIFIIGGESTEPGFDCVGENADLIEGEKIRDVVPIVGQIFVVGGLEFDVAVFEFDENEGKSVDIENEIRAAEAILTLNPQLVDDGEIVEFRMTRREINQPDFCAGLTAVLRKFDVDAVQNPHITVAVDGIHIERALIGGKFVCDAVEHGSGDFRIQPSECLP